MTTQWKPDFEKWYGVKKEAYKFIFEQAEKKLADVLSESESITDKSIKMVIAVVAMFAFFVGFLSQNHITLGYNAIFIVLFIADIIAIVFLIFPKEVKGKGFIPSELLPEKLDSEEDKEFQEELLYYGAIVKLEYDIQLMRKKNSFRAKIYLSCLIASLILFCVGAVLIAAEL